MKGKKGQGLEIEHVGSSSDQRTNRWRIWCPCGNVWCPPTTMLSRSCERCPRCDEYYRIDYNSEPAMIERVE